MKKKRPILKYYRNLLDRLGKYVICLTGNFISTEFCYYQSVVTMFRCQISPSTNSYPFTLYRHIDTEIAKTWNLRRRIEDNTTSPIIFCYLMCNFANLLQKPPLYLPKLKVNYFGITASLLAINFIALWCVAPCNLVD